MNELAVRVGEQSVTACRFPAVGDWLLILGHGAGSDQRHRFLVAFAEALAARGVEVVTFNFLYTEQKKRAPDKPPMLEATWRAVIDAIRPSLAGRRLAIGGKSMGGRIASMVAAEGAEGVEALVFLGYPLHPPDRPAQLRTKHLPAIRRPMLFVQGTRDPFGSPDELRPFLSPLEPPPVIHEIVDGDHSFAVRKRVTGRTEAEVFAEAQDAIVRFLQELPR
jgi:predicted alpha/beta-hydrolase family hydrolase